MKRIVEFADWSGLEIRLVYYPPYHSKYNPIERSWSALAKKGAGLTPAEDEAIRGWILSDSLSPGFVQRLAERFGEESIKAAFLLGKYREGYALEYRLRPSKGRFYRPRYPTLTIAD